jgi:hypothetical protein
MRDRGIEGLRRRCLALGVLGTVLSLWLLPAPASAATIVVNDDVDGEEEVQEETLTPPASRAAVS